MAPITWQEFSRRPEIKKLPLHEQKKQFIWENQRRAEENWFLEMQIVAGNSGTPFSGIAIDGPLNGSTVTDGVQVATTNALGEFTFSNTPTGPITVTGGTDSVTGTQFVGELKGFPQYKSISPITTIAYHLATEANLSPDAAIDKVFENSKSIFGVEFAPENKDIILQKDYIKESLVNNDKAGIVAQTITTQIETIAEITAKTVYESTNKSISENKIKSDAYKTIASTINTNVIKKGGQFDTSSYDGIISNLASQYSVTIDNNVKTRLASLVNLIKTETSTISLAQNFDNNYRTSTIQGINRTAKITYKSKIKNALDVKTGDTASLNNILTPTSNDLYANLEKEIVNITKLETDRENVTDKKLATVSTLITQSVAITQNNTILTKSQDVFYYGTLTLGSYLYADGINPGFTAPKGMDKNDYVVLVYDDEKNNVRNLITVKPETAIVVKIEQTKIPATTPTVEFPSKGTANLGGTYFDELVKLGKLTKIDATIDFSTSRPGAGIQILFADGSGYLTITASKTQFELTKVDKNTGISVITHTSSTLLNTEWTDTRKYGTFFIKS